MAKEENGIIDVNPIFRGESRKACFSFPFLPDCVDTTIRFDAPLNVRVEVCETAAAQRGTEGLVEAEMTVEGAYETPCARCLTPVKMPVFLREVYAVALRLENEESDGEGMLLAPDGLLDAREAADALFSMNLPSKHLCSEDCKGLCPGCGRNLNTEKCVCSGKNIDPRLAVLKKLLDK